MRRFIYSLILALVVFNNSAQSNNSLKRLDKIFDELEVIKEFNGNIFIGKNDSIIYHRSIGYADFENKIPNTKETVFELASMSKQFTAMAIMILKENGEFSFDDKVAKYISGFPYSTITIRQLLTMSSGISDYLNFSESWDVKQIVTNASIVEYYNTVKPELEFEPGFRFGYSNVNYVFLAEIVKNVSSNSFSSFLKEHIFDKLNMSATRSYTTRFSKNEVISNYAFPYIKKDESYIKTEENTNTRYVVAASGIEGDGSIISTTVDLMKWVNAIKNGELVMPYSARECHMHVLGITRSGKSRFLFDCIKQDILNGYGVCLIDPHGELYDLVIN